jgi:hypothetical protein
MTARLSVCTPSCSDTFYGQLPDSIVPVFKFTLVVNGRPLCGQDWSACDHMHLVYVSYICDSCAPICIYVSYICDSCVPICIYVSYICDSCVPICIYVSYICDSYVLEF